MVCRICLCVCVSLPVCVCVCVYVCVCMCVRARVRACVRACVRVCPYLVVLFCFCFMFVFVLLSHQLCRPQTHCTRTARSDIPTFGHTQYSFRIAAPPPEVHRK